MLMHTFIAIIVGLLYYGFGSNAATVLENTGLLVGCITYSSFTTMLPAIVQYPAEIPVIRKETFNNWYSLSVYYIAKMCANIPGLILLSIIFTTITYCMTGQPKEVYRFTIFLTIIILVHILSDAIGTLIGTLVEPTNGTFLGSLYTAYCILLSGFFIFFSHMSQVVYVVSYTSFYTYAFVGLAESLYGFSRSALPCPEEELFCQYKMPQEFLKQYGIDRESSYADIACLFVQFVVAKYLGYFTLRRLNSKS